VSCGRNDWLRASRVMKRRKERAVQGPRGGQIATASPAPWDRQMPRNKSRRSRGPIPMRTPAQQNPDWPCPKAFHLGRVPCLPRPRMSPADEKDQGTTSQSCCSNPKNAPSPCRDAKAAGLMPKGKELAAVSRKQISRDPCHL
jgi:hypothetical protein